MKHYLSISQAARVQGISRQTLYTWIAVWDFPRVPPKEASAVPLVEFGAMNRWRLEHGYKPIPDSSVFGPGRNKNQGSDQ